MNRQTFEHTFSRVPVDYVLDVGDSLVTPAFVNSHTHLSMSALRGIEGTARALGNGPINLCIAFTLMIHHVSLEGGNNVVADLYFTIEREMSAADVRAFARMGCYESLLNGVGFVWVCSLFE